MKPDRHRFRSGTVPADASSEYGSGRSDRDQPSMAQPTIIRALRSDLIMVNRLPFHRARLLTAPHCQCDRELISPRYVMTREIGDGPGNRCTCD
jgi:hypothetical protein